MNASATNLQDLRQRNGGGGNALASRRTMAEVLQLPKAKQLPAMLEVFQGEIRRALPSHLSADRITRIALTAFRRTPKLSQCEPASVFAAIIQSAQLGLEVDTLGRAYLVPYGNECQFIPGWKGLVELVHRAGQASCWTGAVFEGDRFDYALGDSPFVKHQPCGEADPSKLKAFYAIGRPKDSEWPIIECWQVPRVTRHRDRYNKVGKKHYSYDNFEMYGRKVVLLQVLKYLPASPELVRAMELNDAAEMGAQHLNVNDAIEGTWEPVDSDGNDERQDDGGRQADPQQDNAGQQQPDGNSGAAPAPAPTAPAEQQSTRKRRDVD